MERIMEHWQTWFADDGNGVALVTRITPAARSQRPFYSITWVKRTGMIVKGHSFTRIACVRKHLRSHGFSPSK